MKDWKVKIDIIFNDGKARRGVITTPHGIIQTPVFMPVGTQATVKALTPAELEEAKIDIILGNTYHLFLRPGAELIKKSGGLHSFMNWKRSILTDSGGYQIFSLSKLRKIEEDGVKFQSHIDGQKFLFTPQLAVDVQTNLGSDIAMVLDYCPPSDSSEKILRKSMKITTKWAQDSAKINTDPNISIFGIIQGGTDINLRKQHLGEITDLDFAGYALGGLSVGETKDQMYNVLNEIASLMPSNKPRYLMGVGQEEDILEAVENGVDMFDCVIPTRNGRNGQAFTRYGRISIKKQMYKEDLNPIENGCQCYACRNFTRAYLRHLYVSGEILASRMLSLHNIYYFSSFMQKIRTAIEQNCFSQFKKEYIYNLKESI